MSTGAPAMVSRPVPSVLARLWVWMAADTVPGAAGGAAATGVGHDEDDASMCRMAQGHTHALRSIFDRWKLPLLSYFYRSLGSRADAEDLTLQTLERVYRSAARYRPEGRFPAWLFAIARGELLHELRRRRRKPLVPVPPEDLVGVAAADSHPHTRELEEFLLHALQALPERQRSAVLLAAAGELEPAQIALTLGVSLNHLHVILHRARQTLRERLNPITP